MAYNRRYWRRYYRRYYRGKFNSYAKTRMSRNFKASANNMTQGGTFNISSRGVAQCIFDSIPSGGSNNISKSTILNIPAAITQAAMHIQLSNVFDQYRVERLVIRVRPIGDTANSPALQQPSLLFTAIDRSGFAASATIDQFRTYGSYKETQISGAKDISPTHTVYVSQSNLVEWSTWSDTKSMVSFPSVALGVFFAHLPANTTVNLAIEYDFQIRYRGVRLDTSAIPISNVRVGTIDSNYNISFTTDVPLNAWTLKGNGTHNVSLPSQQIILVIRVVEDQFFYYSIYNDTPMGDQTTIPLRIEGPCFYSIVTDGSGSTVFGMLDNSNVLQLAVSPIDIQNEYEEYDVNRFNMSLANLDIRKYFNISQ